MAVFRCFTERKPGFDIEARALRNELALFFDIGTEYVRIFNRYDLEGIDGETYRHARKTILSEPQTDFCYDEHLPDVDGEYSILAVEALPGQYDQRADSCAQCIQVMTRGERPAVRTARVYVFGGNIKKEEMELIRKHLINPVETREASDRKPDTLKQAYPEPCDIGIIDGFIKLDADGLKGILDGYGLAMDIEDLRFLQDYFRTEKRDPTLTELRVIDTYWSDHCRHTTFLTHLTTIAIKYEPVREAFEEYLEARREVYGEAAENRPVTLMDIATMGMKLLKKRGLLPGLDESEEINACSVRVTAMVDGEPEEWVLMFKNETHNHPTEIEPFGGAATCLGGAIRDPLSGRSYVYQAMRVTGSGDPTVPISETIEGKLPQRKITTLAAAGYSSYGNQVGLATGLVHEIYHPGYVAKRMEIGAVVGAAPYANIVRERPRPGDLIILLGGRTGRDGCGGATGSSKSHTLESLTECAAEVQKGNPPEERKIQRLFRKPEVSRMIKRCNDFGAGGVSVAIGELADGLLIYLDRVPKKYEGLDGTELAISESQERMAVVVDPSQADAFISEAARENLEATVVAEVTEEPRLRMIWRGRTVVDISRKFLNTNGAVKRQSVKVKTLPEPQTGLTGGPVRDRLIKMVSDLNIASLRGLVERFDSTIGAGSVLVPFGGRTQRNPVQVMAALLPAEKGNTSTCSVMSFGFDPAISEQNPFEGAVTAVVSSVAKLVAAGCDYRNAYLTLQEYFEKLRKDPERWGKPLAALLGAFKAQTGLGIAAIGGKDSMSGSFMDLDVPPTLVSFAVAAEDASNILSPEFKRAGNPVYVFEAGSVHDFDGLGSMWSRITGLARQGKIVSAWACGRGGIAEGIVKMAFGNRIGFKAFGKTEPDYFFRNAYTAIIIEATEPLDSGRCIGRTSADPVVEIAFEKVSLDELLSAWEKPLESVFPTRSASAGEPARSVTCYDRSPLVRREKVAIPLAVIPAFPGTNCEEDTKRAVEAAGGKAKVLVIRNLTPSMLDESIRAFAELIGKAQMIIIPGGFSGGDEPDGSAKFITSFFRNPLIAEATHELLYKRDGLMLGICNGFQALVKLGLLPFGEIRPMDEASPTLTLNLIGRHQSRYVLTRVSSVKSPWMSLCSVGDIYAVPVSHGEGRFVASESILEQLRSNGQIALQYADMQGRPSMDIEYNPNGSCDAIEAILSPDGRILGKMGHTERQGIHLAKNIPFNKNQPIFASGVSYFK
jgi:phosphoribosylformylglycinamidine synthase